MVTEEPKAPKSSRWQFSLRTLLLGVAALAILLVAGRHFYDWYHSRPLADAVAEFNARASSDPVVKHEPPITEDEIVSSIEAQLPNLHVSYQVKETLSRIANTKRLPPSVYLNYMTSYEPLSGKSFTSYFIILDRTDQKSSLAFPIRETNNPAVAGQKSQSAPP